MRVGYSATIWDGGRSGVGTYIAEQISALRCRDDVELRAIEFGGRVLAPSELPKTSGTDAGTHRRLRPLRDVLWHRTRLAALAASERFDLVHVPTIRRLPGRQPCPVVVTVHDLAPLRLPSKYGPARQVYYRRVLPRWLQAVDAIVTPSRSTKDDLEHFYGVEPRRITVVPNGVNHDLYHPDDPERSARVLQRQYGIRPPYLVYVSRLEHPAKNHVRLIEAFRRFKEQSGAPHQLVLVGERWNGHESIERAAAPLVETKEVVLTGHVPSADVPHFLRAADALIFPSLYEGFGMPIVEAMASGTPVACSRASSLTEVADGCALLFDPTRVEDMADALVRITGDLPLRHTLREEGTRRARAFTWRRCVEETIGVWRRVLGRDGPRGR
jgi:glycosyltransferase involved in cell wall biosynthesis